MMINSQLNPIYSWWYVGNKKIPFPNYWLIFLPISFSQSVSLSLSAAASQESVAEGSNIGGLETPSGGPGGSRLKPTKTWWISPGFYVTSGCHTTVAMYNWWLIAIYDG